MYKFYACVEVTRKLLSIKKAILVSLMVFNKNSSLFKHYNIGMKGVIYKQSTTLKGFFQLKQYTMAEKFFNITKCKIHVLAKI